MEKQQIISKLNNDSEYLHKMMDISQNLREISESISYCCLMASNIYPYIKFDKGGIKMEIWPKEKISGFVPFEINIPLKVFYSDETGGFIYNTLNDRTLFGDKKIIFDINNFNELSKSSKEIVVDFGKYAYEDEKRFFELGKTAVRPNIMNNVFDVDESVFSDYCVLFDALMNRIRLENGIIKDKKLSMDPNNISLFVYEDGFMVLSHVGRLSDENKLNIDELAFLELQFNEI